MNKLLALSILPFTSLFSLSKCKLSSDNIDYSEKYNPYTIACKSNFTNWYATIGDYEYRFNYEEKEEADLIRGLIVDATPYTNIDQNDMREEGDNFTYRVYRSVLMWGSESYTMTFYANGYAKVKTSGSNLPSYYYYSFDADKAAKLYNKAFDIVDAHHQEEIDRDNEYNRCTDFINGIKLDTVLDDIKEQTPLNFEYNSITDYYLPNVNLVDDEGEIKNLILNATYTPTTNDRRNDNYTDRYIYIDRDLVDEQGNKLYSYRYSLRESNFLVTISVWTFDKYGRNYHNEYYFNIGRTSTHAIFDKAIEKYEAIASEIRQTKDRVDGVTMGDIINDIRTRDPLVFEYQPQSWSARDPREITDDGTIKQLLINATYETCNDNRGDSWGVTYEDIRIVKEVKNEDGEVIDAYYCSIFSGSHLIELNTFAMDKYGRCYYCTKNYDIDKESCDAIFAKVVELNAAR